MHLCSALHWFPTNSPTPPAFPKYLICLFYFLKACLFFISPSYCYLFLSCSFLFEISVLLLCYQTAHLNFPRSCIFLSLFACLPSFIFLFCCDIYCFVYFFPYCINIFSGLILILLLLVNLFITTPAPLLSK